MRKTSLLLSGLVVFSLAACSKSSSVNSKAIDPSSLYTQKITISSTYKYSASGGQASLPQEVEYVSRKYDSHNRVCFEQLYAQSKVNFTDYEGATSFNKSSASSYTLFSTTSYTNRYDKNGNLVYCFILRIDRESSFNSSYESWTTTYGCENYSYDNLNRLIQKTAFGTVYDTPTYITNSSLQWETTYTDIFERYTYVGDSREYKTCANYVVKTTEDLLNTGSLVNKSSELIVREFNEHNDISKETCISYNKTKIIGYNNGNNGSVESVANPITLISYNTYDKHHCLIKSVRYKYTSYKYGGDTKFRAGETIYSYYKNNPKKPLHCSEISYTSGGVASYNSCSCDYDSRGRLKNKTTTLRTGGISSFDDEHNNSSAKHATRTTIELYTY